MSQRACFQESRWIQIRVLTCRTSKRREGSFLGNTQLTASIRLRCQVALRPWEILELLLELLLILPSRARTMMAPGSRRQRCALSPCVLRMCPYRIRHRRFLEAVERFCAPTQGSLPCCRPPRVAASRGLLSGAQIKPAPLGAFFVPLCRRELLPASIIKSFLLLAHSLLVVINVPAQVWEADSSVEIATCIKVEHPCVMQLLISVFTPLL